jgi:uncharacterized membrane protein
MERSNYTVLLFAAVGVLFVLLGIPLKQGAVPPNWWYGFRTKKTLSDKEIWYTVNRVTGIDMIRIGCVLIAASLIVFALRNWLSPEASVAVLIVVMLVMVVYMAFHGLSILRRM